MKKRDYDEVVDGLTSPTFTFRGETFAVKPVMPPAAFDDLAEIQRGEAPPRVNDALMSIIERSLVPDDRQRWRDLMEREADAAVPIAMATLAEIADDIAVETMGRPPQQSSPSTATPASTQTRSTDDSDSRAAKASGLSTSVPV